MKKSKRLSKKFKIIIDTNVWISAIFWGGKPRKIIKLWVNDIKTGQENIKIYLTNSILKEIIQKIKKIAKEIKLDKRKIVKWVHLIEKRTIFVNPVKKVNICRDKKDNKFLEAVLEAQADYLITGDKDLLTLEKFKKTQIIKPAQFLKQVYKN